MNNLFFSNSNCQNEITCVNHNFKHENKKFSFKNIKNNTFNSLNEVEYFLNNFQKFSNSIKLYKILKNTCRR